MTSQFLRENDPLAVSLPITTAAVRMAESFARSQSDPVKATAVYRNTIAVCVVNDYCQMMAIPTDLQSSDSWNPLIRSMSDVADLLLPGMGQLECRPVHHQATACQVPPDVWDLRVGYVMVALDDDHQTAQLLGFVPSVNREEIPVSQLQPIENLLDHLYELQRVTAPDPATRGNLAAHTRSDIIVNLSRWLNASFEAGWQAIEELLSPGALTPAFSFRGETAEFTDLLNTAAEETDVPDVRRAKLIDLALQMGPQPVVLVVEMQMESPQHINIGLQVHPAAGQPYLPAGLEMAILEATDEVFMRVQSRRADNYVQLQFTGTPGERFKVLLTLEEARYLEEFVL